MRIYPQNKEVTMCERYGKCALFMSKLVIESHMSSIFVKKYCECNKANCARYKVAQTLGIEYVTNTLFPFMADKAESIIAEKLAE